MLHELLASNRGELIRRCNAKTAQRIAPVELRAEIEHGVPMFLEQLIDTLHHEQRTDVRPTADTSPRSSPIGRTAALHGAELLAHGYSIDQVVRNYGDVCQAVTEMALEQNVEIDADEFRTLNRCLDDAIADAVTAYGIARQGSSRHDAITLNKRLESYADDQVRLIDIAIQSYAAIRTGNIGVTGATGALLVYTLNELRALAGRAVSAIGPPTQN